MLKQTRDRTRELFLKLFIKELIINSKPRIGSPFRKLSREIEKENLKKEVEKEFQEEIRKEKREKINEEELSLLKEEIPRHTPFYLRHIEKSLPATPVKKIGKADRLLKEKSRVSSEKEFYPSIMDTREEEQILQTTSPQTQKILPVQQTPQFPKVPETPRLQQPIQEIEGGLKKINFLLSDRAIMRIECLGPNRNLLVTKFGRKNLTKISLSQKEINEIIEYFSAKARIPVIGGIFKASIGNLTISAVISEFVGSRFIIDKMTPHSLLRRYSTQLQQAQFLHSEKKV